MMLQKLLQVSLSHSLLQNPCLETQKSLGHNENYLVSLCLELREHRFSGLYVYSALNLKVCFLMESFLQEITLKILSVQVIITFHMTIHQYVPQLLNTPPISLATCLKNKILISNNYFDFVITSFDYNFILFIPSLQQTIFSAVSL